ncbi:MAG: M23 family metallopeptidase [Pyrinomonadaceae bacterium]|nr:M23 family metallopeptidase [Pyrinomonadaceae bacterium]
MKRFLLILRKTLLIILLLIVYSIVIVVLYENFIRTYLFLPTNYAESVGDPTEKTPVPTPLPIPSIEPTVIPPPEINTNQTQNNAVTDSPTALMIPVVGIKREQLRDTFNDARSEGRVHNAIDIMAAGGTPVVAVADGEIAKFFDSERGGITIYQYSSDRRFVYYYAHLQKRADNLKEKDSVKRGTVIGYVGDTGNSGAGNYHLHFSVTLPDDPKKIFEGTEINPYPLLKNGIESR